MPCIAPTLVHAVHRSDALAPVVQAAFDLVDDLDETARGAGGFGSTGRG